LYDNDCVELSSCSHTCTDEDVKKLQYIDELTSLLEQQIDSFDDTLEKELQCLEDIHEYTAAIIHQSSLLNAYKALPIFESAGFKEDKNKENVECVNTTDSKGIADTGTMSSNVSGGVVTTAELEAISKTTRGRLTISAINEYLKLLHKMVTDKEGVIKKDRRKMTAADHKIYDVSPFTQYLNQPHSVTSVVGVRSTDP
jgi:hypothetical protein